MRIIWIPAFALLISSCQLGGQRPKLTPDQIAEREEQARYEEALRKTSYVPDAGTPRAEVEAVLGNPTHLSRTKDGRIQAMYQIQTARWRNIVYTDRGTVAYSIPAEPLIPNLFMIEE
jgi:Ni,Fe-hydrogenase III large subunit